MKCVLCKNEIDHTKEFHPKTGEDEQRAHAAKLSTWEQITIHLWRGSGSTTIFQGHLCPDHDEEIINGRIVPTISKVKP